MYRVPKSAACKIQRPVACWFIAQFFGHENSHVSPTPFHNSNHFLSFKLELFLHLPINLCHVWDAKYKIIQLINTGKNVIKKRKTYGFYGRNMRYKQTLLLIKNTVWKCGFVIPFFPPRKDLIIFPPPLICRIFMTYFGVFWQYPLKIYHNSEAR